MTDLMARAKELLDLTEKRHHWWGICPFHEEKTPSFMIDERRQTWWCFRCSKGGDLDVLVDRLELEKGLEES